MPLYIPPQGVFFRLKTCPGNTTLFLGSDGSLTNESAEAILVENPGPGAAVVNQARPTNTWLWEIIPSDNSKPRDAANTYKIRNKRTNTFLSLDSAAKMMADPSMITIEPSQKDHRFRLRCDNFILFSRDHEDPRVGTLPANSTRAADQQFEFYYPNLKFNRLVYHVEEATIQNTSVFILLDQTVTNDSREQRMIQLSCDKSFEHKSTFEYAMGITIEAGFKFKADVPTVNMDRKISISSDRHNWKWGTENTTTTEHKLDFPFPVHPFTKMVNHAEVTKGTLHVPFTAYHKTDTDVEVETRGIYKGTSSWGLDVAFNETKLPSHPGELTRNSPPSKSSY